METYFKIYDPERDLFYAGGGRWSKKGKVYTQIGHVKLAMHKDLGRFTQKLNERLELLTFEAKAIDKKPLTDIKRNEDY